jgi:competence protein ComEC
MTMLVPPWSRSPFTRLLIPLTGGIILQWYLPQSTILLTVVFLTGIIGISAYHFLSFNRQYRISFLSGLSLNLVFLAIGSMLVAMNDLREETEAFERSFDEQEFFIAILQEPLVEKTRSYKALAHLSFNMNGKIKTAGVILYFSKDVQPNLQYGSVICFRKKPQPVRNSGNPGGFDYKRFLLFEGITFQCFLKPGEYLEQKEKQKDGFTEFITNCRLWTIDKIQKFIPGKKEQGLAEAIVIGYKNDLDKDLVKAYSNTGVVHVIAISGLHLGLVYWILLMLTKPLKRKRSGIGRLLIIIAGLWIFSIIAGAQPSVVRSALMFSCIAMGETIQKRSGIYNTLAFSAFMLLCYNPFWLWDAGFQLSYAAVFSIVSFSRPLYNLFYFPNRLIDTFWKINAVTFSAQVLTLPLGVFHFHQFPNLFFMANILAVPLASLILISVITLCAISFFAVPAGVLGQLIHYMIFGMNSYIERFDGLKISVSSGLYISVPQTILLTVSIFCLCLWLIERKIYFLYPALVTALLFTALRSHSFYSSSQKKNVLVYNIAKYTLIEKIEGRNSLIMADKEIFDDPAAYDQHIRPSHVLHRISCSVIKEIPWEFNFGTNRVVIIERPGQEKNLSTEKTVLLIVRGRSHIKIEEAIANYQPAYIVLDGSVPQKKVSRLKNILDSMRVNYHHVQEKGAFILPPENLPL